MPCSRVSHAVGLQSPLERSRLLPEQVQISRPGILIANEQSSSNVANVQLLAESVSRVSAQAPRQVTFPSTHSSIPSPEQPVIYITRAMISAFVRPFLPATLLSASHKATGGEQGYHNQPDLAPAGSNHDFHATFLPALLIASSSFPRI